MIAMSTTKTTLEDRVELESASPPISDALAAAVVNDRKKDQIFVQVAAFSNPETVLELSAGLARLYQVSADAPLIGNIYKLRLGPLKNEQKAEKLIQDLKSIGFDSAFSLIAPAD
jgi:rare lipoprotein A